MDLQKDNYTKEEVQELLNTLNGQVAELTAQLTDSTANVEGLQEQLKDVDTLEKQNIEGNIKLELLKNGLSENLFDLVNADSVENAVAKIEKLKSIQKQNILDNSYKPENHANTDDAYAQAEKEGNVQNMLKNKLSKLFI